MSRVSGAGSADVQDCPRARNCELSSPPVSTAIRLRLPRMAPNLAPGEEYQACKTSSGIHPCIRALMPPGTTSAELVAMATLFPSEPVTSAAAIRKRRPSC
jgi:hypothetical protein